jgi:HEAT repeat protein
VPPHDSIQPKIDAAALQDQRREASRQRVKELAQLGATKDAKSLPSILSDLTSGDAEIRRAALSATLDYGDRSTIPVLQEAMDTLPDPQEKVNIRDAINYLKLPTLTEMNVSSRDGNAPSLPPGN